MPFSVEETGENTPLVPRDSNEQSALRVAASCMGFLADAYDLFTIDLVVLILQFQYGEEVFGVAQKSYVVSMMLAGVVIGQLTFGFAADLFGRKKMFLTTAVLTVLGALASAAVDSGGTIGLPSKLALCRFVLGLGVGGEYPLSATVTAESAGNVENRGRLMALVLSMQGFGMMLSSLVALVAIYSGVSLDATWRLLLGFGAFPSSVAFALRWQMHETEAFEKSHELEAASSSRHVGSVITSLKLFWQLLVGTSSTWLLMNIFQYSLGSFKSTILDELMPSFGMSNTEKVVRDAQYAAVVSSFAIVGFAIGNRLILGVSRFTMQLGGFFAVTLTLLEAGLLNSGSSRPSAKAMLVVLGLLFLFINSGPNITTFILPAEVFPTRVRATFHGISAASGKIGALLGTAAFPPISAAYGMGVVYFSCSAAAFAAFLLTYLFTPRQVVELSMLEGPAEDAIATMYGKPRQD